ncbi:lysozyme [Nostoc parmelioides]|uniref:Lysozyme n=1 Tax=Nostoc parmelioides FACHB-3921 TaxID=2692909 RepID=A0ABR8BNF6_9NOSO|nr:lysozyme [Nostoc parmelioides]MBD2254440.1 lysozyme [Nostoc parmelioides FACHB-3921]
MKYINQEINQEGLDLIKHFEGFSTRTYYCQAGVLTIGYGTTGNRVRPGLVIDQKTAEQWLLEDIRKFEDGVESRIKVKLGSNQFSALVCFAYNVGLGEKGFGGSTLLRKLNSGDYTGAAAEFDKWVKAGGRSRPGLVRRRNAEKDLFLKPDGVLIQEANNVKPFQSNRIRITHPTYLKLKTRSHVELQENKEKVSVPSGCEFPVLTHVRENRHVKVTFGDKGGDIKFAGRNTWYLWEEHFEFVQTQNARKSSKPENLAEQVVQACEARGYPLREDEWNLVGISGLAPKRDRTQGYVRDTTPDKWNDSIGVIAKNDGEWEFLCLYLATTEPGRYYTTVKLLNPKGSARLDFGYHRDLWRFGLHRGYEALVQAGTARLVRDTNKNFQRDDKESFEQGNGVNLHTTKTTGWRGSADINTIGQWSAGCNVIFDSQEFKDLMELLKRSPQYKTNSRIYFDYRLLWHEWLE